MPRKLPSTSCCGAGVNSMNKSVRRATQAAFVILWFLIGSSPTWAAFGRTSGAASVSDTGQANYTIPIFTPPGTNGLTPSLSLNYSSGSREGLFGYGWSLTGLSGISRCANIVAADGVASNVQNFGSDKLCLDGNKLRLITGTYGQAGSVYRTEMETYSRITAYGAAGNGPAYFIVERKDGLIYEYGNTSDSRIESKGQPTARLWAVNKIRDRNQNAILFNYFEDTANGSFRILTIQYTQNTTLSVTPPYTVTFNYSGLPAGEVDTNYIAASIIQRISRATYIDVNRGTTLIRRYNLSYEANLSNTAKSRLSSVQECAGVAGTDCLAATTFTYQNGSPGFGTEVNSGITAAGSMPLDVNGDGRTDLVYSSTTTSGTGVWMVMFANASGGYGVPVSSSITNQNYSQAIPIDYNADGLDDFLVPKSTGTWYAIQGTTTGLATPIDTLIPATGAGGNARTMDINGDGLDDLVFAIVTGGTHSIQTRLRIAGATFGSPAYVYGPVASPYSIVGPVFGYGQFNSRKRNPDINGDGLADILVHSREWDPGIGYMHTWEIVRLGGAGVVYIGNFDAVGGPYWPDLNGDRCSDLVYTRAGYWRYRFSNCYGLGPEVQGPALNPMVTTEAAVFDWDGDGFEDIVGRDQVTFRWDYMRSTGGALSAIADTGIATSAVGAAQVADVNGDGLDDLLFRDSSGIRRHMPHAGLTPDLLLTATDGLGVFTTFSYTTLAQNNYTKGSGNSLAYPYLDWQSSMPVVASKLSSNGNGGSYTTSYWYYGAAMHVQGRGFAGFWKVKETDGRNGLPHYKYFDQTFPLTGAVKKTELLQTNDLTPITTTTVTNTPVEIDSTANNKRHYFYPSTVTSQDYELSSNATYNGILLRTRTSTNSFDAATGLIYDQVATITEPASANGLTAGGTWITRKYMPVVNILNDTTNWCIGRPGQTQQIDSHNQTYGSQLTRTASTSWDGPYCRPTEKVAEQGSATLELTTKIYYDSFGNINSMTLSGVGVPSRTTSVVYSDATHPTGQFPLSVTNALNQTTTSVWDYDLGVQTKVTDPNGAETDWQYDLFGRTIREDRADDTYTTWALANCPSCDARVKTYINEQTFSSGTPVLFDRRKLYLDQFDRVIFDYRLRPDGNFTVLKRTFDALGRVERSDFPYTDIGSEAGYATTLYDLLNRPIQVSRPISELNSTLQSTLVNYEGLTTRTVDPQSKTSKLIANAAGQIVRSVDAMANYVSYEYEAFSLPKRVRDTAGNDLQTSDYNLRGMLTSRTDMDMGAWGYSPNALGEPLSQTDAKGQTTTFVYDLLGRLKCRIDGAVPCQGANANTWNWGDSSTSHNIGRLASMSGPGYGETYEFDSIGRPVRTTVSADTTYQFDASYNSFGFLDTFTYPTSTSSYRLMLKYEYQSGQLYRIKDNYAPTTIFWTADTFNGGGQLTQETLGSGVNAIVTNRVFDAVTGWLRSVQTGLGGGTGIQNLTYTWDLVGNLSSRKDVNQSNLTETFSYDDLYRLDLSQLNGVTNHDLSYDALGNISFNSLVPPLPDPAVPIGNYTYHASRKHLVTSTANGWSFGYDSNGNMTTGRGATINWTAQNLPSSITKGGLSSSFSYTPNLQYWKQDSVYSNGSSTTVYLGGLLEKVTTTSPTTSTDYRHMIRAGGSTIIVTRQTGGTNAVNYVTSDHLGSSSAILNSSGAILVNSSFGAFGHRRGANWTGFPSSGDWSAIAATTRRGYTDHTMLDNLNLIHMNGRVQDPLLGRFISADPFVPDPLSTQGFNRYSYLENRPLSLVDPSGFSPKRPGNYLPEQDRDFNWGNELMPPPPCFGMWCSERGPAWLDELNDANQRNFGNDSPLPSQQVDGAYAAPGADEEPTPVPPRSDAPQTPPQAPPCDMGMCGSPRPNEGRMGGRMGAESAVLICVRTGVVGGVTCTSAAATGALAYGIIAVMMQSPVWNGLRRPEVPHREIVRRTVTMSSGSEGSKTGGPPMAGASESTTGGPGQDPDDGQVGPYGSNGGHHPVSQAAVRGDSHYNPNTAVSISQAEMRRLGIDHQVVTNTQRALYREFAGKSSVIGWQDIYSIETQALVRGGASPQLARRIVSGAIQDLKDVGVSQLRVPYGP